MGDPEKECPFLRKPQGLIEPFTLRYFNSTENPSIHINNYFVNL